MLSRRQQCAAVLWMAGVTLLALGIAVADLAGLAPAGLALGVAGVVLYCARSSPAPRLPGERAPRRGLGEDGADEPGAPCAHPAAVAVDLGLAAGGERVAWWCEECKTQLAADFTPPLPAAARPGGADAVTRMTGEDILREALAAGGVVRGPAVALYTRELAAPAGYTVTGSWRRRHWHAGPEGCASCAGSDASGARVCLCGRCAAAAAASVMG